MMLAPNVANSILDQKRGITFVVMAYRKMTEDELNHAVVYFYAHTKKKPKKGSRVTIISTIGAG